MISKTVIVRSEEGLHARPAALFVQTAQKFKSNVSVSVNDASVNAKSMLGVLSLGVTKNTTLLIVVEGEDEAAAASALSTLVEADFGEGIGSGDKT